MGRHRKTATDPSRVHERRWVILGVLVLSLLIVVLDNTILNVALKVIADPVAGLGATQGQLEWAINSYTLIFAGMLFTWGIAGDRLGRRRILSVGFVMFGVASLACAYSRNPTELVAARALMGFGGAAVLPSTLAIISNVFEPAERPKAIGIWAGAVGLAIAIGPITGGVLLEHFWWGSVFLINVPITVLGLVLIRLLVPESLNPVPGRLDPLGVLLQVSGLVLVVYGIIRAGDRGNFTDVLVWGSLAAGAAVLLAFGWHERRTDHPVLDLGLFSHAQFSAAVAAIALTFFALMGVTFFMVFYLQVVRGYTPLQSGVRLLPLALGQLIFSPLSATLVKRLGAKAVCAGGLALVAAAFFALLLLSSTSSIWVLEVIFFVQGAGMANVMPPATESIMASLPRERAGVGSAVNNTFRQVGGALGVAILGTVLSSSYRRGITPTLDKLPVPASAKEAMAGSIQATYAVIERVGGSSRGLIGPANDAFVHAMHVTGVWAGVVAILGVVVTALFMPGRSKRPVAQPESIVPGDRDAVPEPAAAS